MLRFLVTAGTLLVVRYPKYAASWEVSSFIVKIIYYIVTYVYNKLATRVSVRYSTSARELLYCLF